MDVGTSQSPHFMPPISLTSHARWSFPASSVVAPQGFLDILSRPHFGHRDIRLMLEGRDEGENAMVEEVVMHVTLELTCEGATCNCNGPTPTSTSLLPTLIEQ